jgi:putative polysaccharide biosynthesis protein
MVAARSMIRRHFGRDHHPARRALARALTMIAWPVAVLIHLWRIRRSSGPKETPIRRAPGAIWAAMRHNILPAQYYAYALWLPERRMKIDNYLYCHEAARIFKLINEPLQNDPIGDKLAFWETCEVHAIPSPPVLAAFAPSGKLLEFQSGQPPELDLFVKPRVGLAGDGTERFRWRGGVFESECGRHLGRQGLVDHLAARAVNEKRTLLVQPNLSNHPNLRVQTNGALATARLVTGHSTDGNIVAIFGLIYFARSDRITVQHGRVALIDVESGRLVPAPLEDSKGGRNSNPQADQCDLMLPDWQAAVQHAKAAHRACTNIAFVAWDIAFTNHGPMLLEGNANWTADEYQSLTGEPLGHTQFATILATRLSASSHRVA